MNFFFIFSTLPGGLEMSRFVAVFLDLSKAFDLINHNILLEKLKRIGLNDSSISWFRSYLSNRQIIFSLL